MRRFVYFFVIMGGLLTCGLFAINTLNPAGRPVIHLSGVDPLCYFSTAHSLVFDHDFNYWNQFMVVKQPLVSWTAVQQNTGLPGSPFAIGYPLLEIPFLAVGTMIDWISGQPSDGYSQYALVFYYLGNIIFLIIGLIFLFLFLYNASATWQGSEHRRRWESLLVTLMIWLSTTLGYYTFSPMSHVAGFMTLSMFLWVWWMAKDRGSILEWAILGLCGGLVALVRWQNILYLAAPILYDLLQRFIHKENVADNFGRWLCSRAVYAGMAIASLIPQLLQWKVIYGSYLIVPQGEGFLQFPPRYMLHVLFSTQHGWFIWTPITMLCVAGLLYGALFWNSRSAMSLFLPWLLILILEIGVIGAQPSNWHNEAFGTRSLTCSLPVAALGLSILAGTASRRMLPVLVCFTIVLSVFTLVFAVQYRMDLLPKDDRLTPSELLTDKLFFPRSYQRQQVALAGTKLALQGEQSRAAELIDQGIRRLGADRRLLQAWVQVNTLASRLADAQLAQEQLDSFLDRRLW